MEQIFCNACSYGIDDPVVRASHYKTEWHRYNVKRRCAGLQGIPQGLFEQKIAVLKARSVEESKVQNHSCKLCSKNFKSVNAYRQHMETKAHKKRAVKAEKIAAAKQKAANAHTHEHEHEHEHEHTHDDNCTHSNDDAVENKDADGMKVETEPKKKFEDAEGLLTYLGYKIGMGKVCLYCNGRGRQSYPDIYAVWQHMKSKSHCKIRIDDDQTEEEFLEFYTFPDSNAVNDDDEDDVQMLASTAANDDAEADAEADTDADAAEKKQKSNALVVAEKPKRKRHLKGMNDAGELVMSDGSLIGHRQYVSAYRQNHRTTESRESVQIAKLMAEYKALQLPGFGHDRTKFSENTYRVQKMINKQRMRFGNNKAMRLTNKVAAHHFKQQVPM